MRPQHLPKEQRPRWLGWSVPLRRQGGKRAGRAAGALTWKRVNPGRVNPGRVNPGRVDLQRVDL